jgi:hypothetical protein
MLLSLVISNAEVKFLVPHNWPVREHEVADQISLGLIWCIEITKSLIVSYWQIEVQIHERENIFRWTVHDIC